MMKGFLSEGVRDLIAILGLALAIIQVIAIFFSGPLDRARSTKQTRDVNHTLTTALKLYVKRLPGDAKSSAVWFLVIISVIFVLGAIIPFVPEELEALIANFGLMPAFFGEFICLGIFLETTDEWMRENAAGQTWKWRLAMSSCWLSILLISVYSIGRFNINNSWLGSAFAFELIGLFFASALMLGYLTYLVVKRLIMKRS